MKVSDSIFTQCIEKDILKWFSESILKCKGLHTQPLDKFGSSDWTRTSDIRINSPPFYRLNYRGIVGTGRIITRSAVHVKGVNHIFDAFGEGVRNISTFSHDRLD